MLALEVWIWMPGGSTHFSMMKMACVQKEGKS